MSVFVGKMGESYDSGRGQSTRIVDISQMMSELHASETILAVDDDMLVLTTIERQMKSLGYQVRTAANGEEALEELEAGGIAIVVADQNMPGMSGLELLKRVASDQPNIVRVMATGDPELSTAISAINDGQVYRILTKPWNIKTLQVVLKAAIEHRRILVENEAFKMRIQVQNEELRAFNQDLEARVEARTAEVIKQSKRIQALYGELDESFDAMLSAMVAVTTVGEPRISQHCHRTRACVKQFCDFLGIAPAASQIVERAAMVHWIGLLNAPPKVFSRSISRFGDDEKIVWEFHPALGANAIYAIPALKGVSEIVANYLEKPDSRHFSGEEQRTACQVLKIASLYKRTLDIRKRKGDSQAHLRATEELDRLLGHGEIDVAITQKFLEFVAEYPSGTREETSVQFEDLQPGMVFSRPITTGGVPVVTRDLEVTDEVKSRLRKIVQQKGINEIWVWQKSMN